MAYLGFMLDAIDFATVSPPARRFSWVAADPCVSSQSVIADFVVFTDGIVVLGLLRNFVYAYLANSTVLASFAVGWFRPGLDVEPFQRS